MTDRAVPPSKVWARLAGVLFLFGVLTAASAELFLRGRLPFAAGLILVLCHVAATLLFYQIFRLVSPSLALLAVSFNFAGCSSRPGLLATARDDFLAASRVYNGAQGNGRPRQAISTAGRRNAPDLTLGELDPGFAMAEEHLPRLVEVGPTL